MVPPLHISPHEFLGNEGRNGVINVLDLNQACFTFLSLHTLPDSYSSWPIPMDKIRNPKRLKQASSDDHDQSIRSYNGNLYNGGGSTSTNSRYSLPRLQFRDHVWAYNQRYLAIEAMEEATTSMMGGEEHQYEEEGSGGDEIKLIQQLVSCAEAVACRDKAHASILLYI